MAPSRPSSRRDQGSGTVLVVAAIAVLLSVTLGGLVLGSAVLASHQARLAADLGVLAGARSAQSEGVSLACAEASRVAGNNGASVTSCRLDGAQMLLSVTVPAWPTGVARARARAGPSPGR